MSDQNYNAVKKYRKKLKENPALYEASKARQRERNKQRIENLKNDPIKYSEYLEKEKARSKAKRKNKSQSGQAKDKEYQKKFYSENKEKIQDYPSRQKSYVKSINLYRRYGLNYENYLLLLEKQNNSCAICSKNTEKLVVDHCHNTGIIRGLLCRSCNVAIGFLKEDISILHNAIKYIEEYKEKK